MPRAILIVMVSVGVGGAIDSDKYFNGSISDSGSNTILNIAKACESGIASEGRTGPLRVPTLQSLGLEMRFLYQLEIQPQTFQSLKKEQHMRSRPRYRWEKIL